MESAHGILGWLDSLAAANTSREWIGCRLRLRRTGAVDGPHSGIVKSQRDIASKPLRGCEIYRLPRRVHPRESSYYVVRPCGRRLGCLARAFRANTGAASKANACQLESNRSIGQTAFRIVGAGEVATSRRELYSARAEPDRQFRPEGVCTDSQWISPHAEEVGSVNKADYQSERPYSPRAGPRLRGLGSRRFAIGVSDRSWKKRSMMAGVKRRRGGMIEMRKGFGAFTVIGFALIAFLLAWAARVGEPAPDFTATDTNGEVHKLSEYQGKLVVLEWTNRGCPYTQKHYNSGNMQSLQREWTGRGVVWLTVISSAPGKQGYLTASEENAFLKQANAVPTAVLLDPAGTLGHLYDAKTTPHIFIINPKGALIYNGAIDDRPTTDVSDVNGAKTYLSIALEEATSGKPVSNPTSRPYGCSVKYAD